MSNPDFFIKNQDENFSIYKPLPDGGNINISSAQSGFVAKRINNVVLRTILQFLCFFIRPWTMVTVVKAKESSGSNETSEKIVLWASTSSFKEYINALHENSKACYSYSLFSNTHVIHVIKDTSSLEK